MATYRCSPNAVRLVSMILYCICGVFEFIGFICLITYIPSLCVTARENSTRIWWALNLIFPQIIPDLIFAAGGFFFVTHFYAPIGGAYNLFTAVICIISAIFAFIALTDCGNPAQPLALVAGIFGVIAAGSHITLTTFAAINFEGDDKLFAISDVDDD